MYLLSLDRLGNKAEDDDDESSDESSDESDKEGERTGEEDELERDDAIARADLAMRV